MCVDTTIKDGAAFAALRTEFERCEKRQAALKQRQQELQQAQPQTLSLPTGPEITAVLADLRTVLNEGPSEQRKALLEAHIEEIQVSPNGEALLKANPAGMLSLPDLRCVRLIRAEGGTRTHTPAMDTGF